MRKGGGNRRRLLRAVRVVITVTMCGCGPSPITAPRIEGAVGPTFANLVHLQLARIGLPTIAASEISVLASCQKVMAGSNATGAGNWTCVLDWRGPNGQTLRDTFDLNVGTDGCYAATVESGESQLGGPTNRTLDGRELRNLLYSFEGCFDTSY